eukprot:4186753-Pyramimonas_sp.AAC.1
MSPNTPKQGAEPGRLPRRLLAADQAARRPQPELVVLARAEPPGNGRARDVLRRLSVRGHGPRQDGGGGTPLLTTSLTTK